MMSSGINLVMTVIGFMVSTMFIVFVFTRLVCARIHLNAARRSFPLASRSDLSGERANSKCLEGACKLEMSRISPMLERGLHGLEPFVVANFPIKKYSDEYFSSMRNAQCSVCLGEYHGEDILRILPYCGHSFHVTCIDIWLHQHSTCPVCRISLREIPDKKRTMQPLFSSAIRSQYNLDSNACRITGHRRGLESNGMESIEEDQCAPRADAADSRENISSFSEGKGSRDKNVESPSNL